MSTSGPRYHIPFPKAFLSLNTPAQKRADGAVIPSPEVDTAHSFLSNRQVTGRHYSMSSESSTSSIPSAPSSPIQVVESPTLKAAVPTFLTLNSKYTAPPTTVKTTGEKTTFLSNKA